MHQNNTYVHKKQAGSTLILWLRALGGRLSIESGGLPAVIIDHVAVPDGCHLRPLIRSESARRVRGNALRVVPHAGPQAEPSVAGHEGRAAPVDLYPPALSRPPLPVPYAGVRLHGLLAGVGNAQGFVVSEDPDWGPVHEPPAANEGCVEGVRRLRL
ncbi:hypothetical protein BHM03_00002929 [Ensete ventricosum]|nr:hypothetical protein BHM03_00002929 [Ensete ventricosum]